MVSTGKKASASHFAELGESRSRENARAASWMARSSSERPRSLTVLGHRRDDETIAAVEPALGPAGGHGLGLGPEADAFHAVLVDVAEGRALPAAEGVVGDRHRDRHIDPDHADVDAAGELAGGAAVAGEDGHPVAVLVVRGIAQRLLEGFGADD